MSILTSHMKVIKFGQKYFLCKFFRVFGNHYMWHQNWHQYIWISLCQFFVNLLHSPGIGCFFFDIWHLYDNFTSFDILTYYLNHLSSSQAWAQGYMWHIPATCMLLNNALNLDGDRDDEAHGQWDTWAMRHMVITSLILHGSGHRY